MGCITAGNPIIDLETFDYKNKRWNHKFLKCGTDNLCLFCRSKGKANQRSLTESSILVFCLMDLYSTISLESVCNKYPSANLMEWKNANQQQSTKMKTTTKATRLVAATTSTTTTSTLTMMATTSVTTSALTTLEVTLANTTLQVQGSKSCFILAKSLH